MASLLTILHHTPGKQSKTVYRSDSRVTPEPDFQSLQPGFEGSLQVIILRQVHRQGRDGCHFLPDLVASDVQVSWVLHLGYK